MITAQTQASPSVQISEALAIKINALITQFNWKHALILTIPLALVFYRPLIKLFIPVLSKIKRLEQRNCQIKQIILCSNELVSLCSVKEIVVSGGKSIRKNYADEDCTVLQLLRDYKQKKLFFTHNSAIVQRAEEEEINNLSIQTLWNSFRITKIERPNLQLILIKASEPILQGFIIKFYNIPHNQKQKLGQIHHKTLCILRLNETLNSYELVFSEFEPRQKFVCC